MAGVDAAADPAHARRGDCGRRGVQRAAAWRFSLLALCLQSGGSVAHLAQDASNGVWMPGGVVSVHGRFGFPFTNGWKVVGAVHDQGILSGDYEPTNVICGSRPGMPAVATLLVDGGVVFCR